MANHEYWKDCENCGATYDAKSETCQCRTNKYKRQKRRRKRIRIYRNTRLLRYHNKMLKDYEVK